MKVGGGKLVLVFLTITCWLNLCTHCLHPPLWHGTHTVHVLGVFSSCSYLSPPHNFFSTWPISKSSSTWSWYPPCQPFSPAQPKPRQGLLPPRSFAGSLCPTGSGPCITQAGGHRLRSCQFPQLGTENINWKLLLWKLELLWSLPTFQGLPPPEVKLPPPSSSMTLVPLLWFLPCYRIFTINILHKPHCQSIPFKPL